MEGERQHTKPLRPQKPRSLSSTGGAGVHIARLSTAEGSSAETSKGDLMRDKVRELLEEAKFGKGEAGAKALNGKFKGQVHEASQKRKGAVLNFPVASALHHACLPRPVLPTPRFGLHLSPTLLFFLFWCTPSPNERLNLRRFPAWRLLQCFGRSALLRSRYRMGTFPSVLYYPLHMSFTGIYRPSHLMHHIHTNFGNSFLIMH